MNTSRPHVTHLITESQKCKKCTKPCLTLNWSHHILVTDFLNLSQYQTNSMRSVAVGGATSSCHYFSQPWLELTNNGDPWVTHLVVQFCWYPTKMWGNTTHGWLTLTLNGVFDVTGPTNTSAGSITLAFNGLSYISSCSQLTQLNLSME